MAEALIASGVRTPIGALGGVLAEVSAAELGAVCIREALSRAGISPSAVDEVIMGNVVGAGQGQNPARQAAIRSGLPDSIGGTTVNKVCGSGLKAIMLAAQAIRLADSRVVVAGGMESMSRAPYLLPGARQGYRLGNSELVDAVIRDGLWDVYGNKHMGTYGDQCAAKAGLTRQDQDDFAVRSYTRARKAQSEGVFQSEIVPVTVVVRKTTTEVTDDESPAKFNEEKLRALRPAFGPEGTVTAGNASSINDGAAAVTVCSEEYCEAEGLNPIARIIGSATFSREPEWFTLAPIGAIQRLLASTGWTVDSVDLFEINEAFAAVTLAAERELNIPGEKVNIHGGAVSLGHPIGCSGTRILVTLLNALQRTGGRRGIAALCIGGGEAVAMGIEIL
ncbi:MAG: thiolase family protein [Planctomycetaceae bacterium]|nr:thiolase family protein [Planctomycetaceae bacterium]